MSRRRPSWLSGRALALHLGLLVALPLCGVAAWWQIDRALSGNSLSWLYVFEWPAFAAVAVWLWWVLVRLPTRPRFTAPATPAGTGVRWDPATETPALQAYNRFLADLSAGRAAQRPGRRTSP